MAQNAGGAETTATYAGPEAPQPLQVLCDFDGAAWGDEYLCLRVGDLLRACAAPEPAHGWAYGCSVTTGCVGWYPPDYVC